MLLKFMSLQLVDFTLNNNAIEVNNDLSLGSH